MSSKTRFSLEHLLRPDDVTYKIEATKTAVLAAFANDIKDGAKITDDARTFSLADIPVDREDLRSLLQKLKVGHTIVADQNDVDTFESLRAIYTIVTKQAIEAQASTTEKFEHLGETETVDNAIVQKAPHYQNIPLVDRNGNVTELEAWEIITSLLKYMKLNQQASWAMGDALKYILRCGRKFGDKYAEDETAKAKQDLQKADYYINKVIDWY